jgi:hypothetical protein
MAIRIAMKTDRTVNPPNQTVLDISPPVGFFASLTGNSPRQIARCSLASVEQVMVAPMMGKPALIRHLQNACLRCGHSAPR